MLIVADSRTANTVIISCVFAEAIDQALRVTGFPPHPLVDRQANDTATIRIALDAAAKNAIVIAGFSAVWQTTFLRLQALLIRVLDAAGKPSPDTFMPLSRNELGDDVAYV